MTDRSALARIGILLALLLASILIAVAWPTPGHAQSPVFDGDNANVWVFGPEGQLRRSFTIPEQWTDRAVDAGAAASVLFDDEGASQSVGPYDPADESVVVNQTWQSLPALSGGLPRVSIASYERAVSDAADPNKPGLVIDPPSGSFARTIAVHLRAVEAPAGPGQIFLNWRIDGGPLQTEETTTRTFYLFDDGVYEIEAWASQEGVESDIVRRTITLAVPEGAQRDTDGDGIPDQVEIAYGLDPLSSDAKRDSDGDGWSDLDEIVRGTDPNDPGDVPADSDGDGWSDFDEGLRGTDPGDPAGLTDAAHFFPDAPRARSLTEVEYLLTGSVWSDAAETTKRSQVGQLTALDVEWRSAFDDSKLPSAAQLDALGLLGLSEAALPVDRRPTIVAAALAAGDLPTLRVPAGEPLVLRVRDTAGGTPTAWTAKAWLPSAASPRLAEVSDYLAGLGTPWNTPAEWLAGWVALQGDRLVQPITASIRPDTGPPVALVEGAIAWFDRRDGDNLVLLGNLASVRPITAVERLRDANPEIPGAPGQPPQTPARTLDEIHDDLAALFAPGGALVPLGTTIAGWYANPATLAGLDPSGLLDLTTTVASARLVQGDSANDDALAIYLTRLLVRTPLADIEALPLAQRLALLDPADDSDGDGIPNGDELSDDPERATRPDASDSDGDGRSDAIDSCPNEPEDACRAVEYLVMDSDGDGVVDALDNCMNDANPGQIDSASESGSMSDGIGDACLRPANIRTPVSNLRLLAGESVEFTSLVTELPAAAPLVYAWDFAGGAPSSSAASPGAIQFDTPGSYLVSLTVTDAGGAGTTYPSETRLVLVEGGGPSVDASGPYAGTEGEAIELSAVASTSMGTIVDTTWSFGDGTPAASGNPIQHVWASQGLYAIGVVVTDDAMQTANDATTVDVADSAPTAAFDFVATAPRTFAFSDLSTAYDGVVSWSWDFGDGSPPDATASPTHVFPTSASYQVTLSVTDGDGSIDVVARTVGSAAPVPIPPSALPWLIGGLLAVGAGQVARRERAGEPRHE